MTPSRAFSKGVCVTSELQGAIHEAQMCYWRLVVGEEASRLTDGIRATYHEIITLWKGHFQAAKGDLRGANVSLATRGWAGS